MAKIKTEIFLIGNSRNNKKQEIVVNGIKVSTSNQKIRSLIKDFKKGKYVNQGDSYASKDSANNYVILDHK